MKERLRLIAILARCFSCAIIVLMFAACSKKGETDKGPYPQILTGDLSAFAGTWVNHTGGKIQFDSNGASDFYFTDGFYGWSSPINNYSMGSLPQSMECYAMRLLPPGVDIEGNYVENGEWVSGTLATDNTKVRIVTQGDDPYLDFVYYREKEVSITPSDPHREKLGIDLSEYAGMWVNNYGDRKPFRADGVIGSDGVRAYDFNTWGSNVFYWSVHYGYTILLVQLFHPGIEIISDWGDIIPSDTTKARFIIHEGSPSSFPFSNQVYYREGQAPAAQTNREEPQFVYPVQFNNQTIPITVFYSVSGADGEMMNLDRLVFMYGNTEQTINISPKVMEAGSPESVFSYYILPADYNFDSFLDFAVHHGHFSSWEPDITYKVFLYNQQTANYSINEELSTLPNIRVNNQTQTIISIDGPVTSEYKFVNGKLELIKRESQAFSGPQ